MPVPPLSKAELRRQAEQSRRARVPEDAARDAALAPLLAGRTVASYVPFGTEPVPPSVPGALVPVLLPDRDLGWRRVEGGPDLGVDAVSTVDVVLVPALLVDRRGTRLGRGGGSYDRALLRARGLVVALLHDGELVDELPAEPHDVPVDAVALPSGVLHLPGKMTG